MWQVSMRQCIQHQLFNSSGNKWLQELGDEMFMIISNTVQSKISPFIRFMWEDRHRLEFVAIIIQKFAIAYHLLDIKQGFNSWLLQVVTDYCRKINLAAYWWKCLHGIVNITRILSHKIPKYTITNAINFDWRSALLWLRNLIK